MTQRTAWTHRALAEVSRPIACIVLGGLLLVTAVPAPAQSREDLQEKARRRDLEEQLKKDRDDATRRALQAFSATVEAKLTLVQDLETKNKEFLERLQGLLKNDDGKRLARDDAAFNAVCDVTKKPIVLPEKLAANKLALTSVRDGLNQTLQGPVVGFTSDDPRQAEVYRIASWTADCLAEIADAQNLFTDAIGKAPKDFDVAAAKSLETVIREVEAERRAIIERARHRAKEESVQLAATQAAQNAREIELEQRIAKLEMDLHDERVNLQRQKIEHDEKVKAVEAELRVAETAAKQKEADIEIKYKEALAEIERMKNEAAAAQHAKDVESKLKVDKVISEADKKLLFEKCDDPEVQRLLAPFLADGYWQPGRGGNSVNKGPVSLSRLRASGALQRTPEGLQRLLECGTSSERWAAQRPRWAYNARYKFLKPADLEELKKAQEYLTELGETLVERKMLAP